VTRILVFVLAAAFACTSCQSAEDKARAEFSVRLKQQKPLTRDELVRFYDEIGRALGRRKLLAKQGAVTRELDERQQAAVLGMLSDPTLVGDAGVRAEQGRTLRGLSANGTPPTSEIEATQLLWIDTDSFLPVRYDFTYAMAGLGDFTYDLIVVP
jgi:arsenate reductase-like glutaredoxin family protein